ncbi:MAG: glucosylceramidase [Lentimicrobium sp.]|nr:glucosylceramidase [Lentimicrobium sp.]
MKPILTITKLLVAFLLFGGVISCAVKDKAKPNGPDNPPGGNKVQVYLTKGDKSVLFEKQKDIEFVQSVPTGMAVLKIDTGFKYQQIEGYGAALTGSSAWLINRKLSSVARQSLLDELFNPETGIGVSYLRLTMGASDFSLSDFTYNDLPSGQTDFELAQFSLWQDYDDVIPVLKSIIQVSPEIKLMGSPWSPPAWMKTNNSLVGGKLKSNCYDVYADYFIRYINSMKEEGIVIDAITIQNEPLHYTAAYPCMEMQATEQLEFIKNHLGPKFSAAGIKTKILLYDHNWDEPGYPITILNDPDAKQFITGSAFHAYAGDVSAMSAVHNAHSDKGLYFTEISGGEWATDFAGNLMWNMRNIFIGTARNWSKNALLWNLALNENFGPQNNGCSNCRGVITINSVSGEIIRNEEYYSIAHFSKFVRPGATRVSGNLPQSVGDAGVVAFRNTDGSMTLIAANYGNQTISFAVEQDKTIFKVSIPAVSVSTYTW